MREVQIYMFDLLFENECWADWNNDRFVKQYSKFEKTSTKGLNYAEFRQFVCWMSDIENR